MLKSVEVDSKAMFFDELYALGQVSDDERDTDSVQHPTIDQVIQDLDPTPNDDQTATLASDDLSNIHCVRRTASQPIPTSCDRRLVFAGSSVPHLPRPTLNTLNTTLSTSECSSSEGTSSTNQNIHQRAARNRTVSAPTSTITSNGRMDKSSLGKRKRKDPPLKYVPEAQQIFLGCNFFFIPNDNVAPMRRARIRKAQEHGAVWCSEWSDKITHIIVDKSLSYDQVASFLKLPAIPVPIIMVNDIYPIDCIQFMAILNPKQRQYQVKGQEQKLEKEPSNKISSQTSDVTLHLKLAQPKPGKWDYIPIQETPPRSELSTQTFASTGHSKYQLNNVPASADINSHLLEATGCTQKEGTKPMEEPPSMPTDISPDLGGENALDEMIKEAHRMIYFPLDEDNSDRIISSGDDSEGESTTNESNYGSPSKPCTSSRKGLNKGLFDLENFACMKGGNGMTDTANPNSRTISILQEMADYYTRIGDAWRPIAYRKAISVLRKQSKKITTLEEATALLCIGKRLALKIEEIVMTDHLRRLENAKSEPSDLILQKFMGIYGVGFSQANKWLYSGYSTLEDLKEHANLTENQLLGIEHYDELNTRIPRDEVAALGNIVRATAHAIDPKVEIIIGGSYRRGAATSGDVDCIITKENTSASNEIFAVLRELISRLTSSKFLVAALAVPRSESGTKWHGCCVLPSAVKAIWRRIDFLLVPASELGAALIYFTGNDIFNRSIRLLASRKGMRLNQRGLYKCVMRGTRGVKLNEGKLVEGADEKKIFTALGVPWRPPEQRIC